LYSVGNLVILSFNSDTRLMLWTCQQS